VKLYYVAQVAYAPPTFAIQCNRPEAIGDAYRRFVENRFRESFGLEVPMRLLFKLRKRRDRPPAKGGGKAPGAKGAGKVDHKQRRAAARAKRRGE
jgi:GTP-binding protein